MLAYVALLTEVYYRWFFLSPLTVGEHGCMVFPFEFASADGDRCVDAGPDMCTCMQECRLVNVRQGSPRDSDHMAHICFWKSIVTPSTCVLRCASAEGPGRVRSVQQQRIKSRELSMACDSTSFVGREHWARPKVSWHKPWHGWAKSRVIKVQTEVLQFSKCSWKTVCPIPSGGLYGIFRERYCETENKVAHWAKQRVDSPAGSTCLVYCVMNQSGMIIEDIYEQGHVKQLWKGHRLNSGDLGNTNLITGSYSAILRVSWGSILRVIIHVMWSCRNLHSKWRRRFQTLCWTENTEWVSDHVVFTQGPFLALCIAWLHPTLKAAYHGTLPLLHCNFAGKMCSIWALLSTKWCFNSVSSPFNPLSAHRRAESIIPMPSSIFKITSWLSQRISLWSPLQHPQFDTGHCYFAPGFEMGAMQVMYRVIHVALYTSSHSLVRWHTKHCIYNGNPK